MLNIVLMVVVAVLGAALFKAKKEVKDVKAQVQELERANKKLVIRVDKLLTSKSDMIKKYEQKLYDLNFELVLSRIDETVKAEDVVEAQEAVVYRSIVDEDFVFNKDSFKAVKNGSMNKPSFGFWACQYNGELTAWEDWCQYEAPEFLENKTFFDFTLSNNARILNITTSEEYKELTKTYGFDLEVAPGVNYKVLDYERMSEDFDALFISQDVIDEFYRASTFTTQFFNVESLIVFNPYVVKAA